MAAIKIPVKIDGYKCVEDIAQAVLNYTYKGKTLKEWADSISKPQTNADRIRAMTDEELAEWLDNVCKSAYDEGYTKDSEPLMSPYPSTASEWFTWLKQEASDGKD